MAGTRLKKGDRWSREELVRVLALYCRTPFGRMDARNPDVRSLANQIGRTANAVALKLVNFASLDPELRGRGVGGMRNASRADKDVWSEYYRKWETLADAELSNGEISNAPKSHEMDRAGTETAAVREIAVRRGQAFFRAAVLAAYDGTCCITGIAAIELLRASHIVPWAMNQDTRLDPRNGLCLNALHDAAFDRGLVTLSQELELMLSSRLRKAVPPTVFGEMFESRAGSPIRMPERFVPCAEYLAFHREKIFRG